MTLAYRISNFNRHRKWQQFMQFIRPQAAMRVLDVGFTDREYAASDNFIEKNYPFPEQLVALGVEQPDNFHLNYPDIPVVRYNGQDFPFKDQAFDLCWSNAVLEHVGGFEKQLHFLKEIKRIAEKVFLTTPNRYFPIELHTRTPFLHYLPKAIFDRYLQIINKSWAAGDYMYLLGLKEIRQLLKRAGISDYQVLQNRFLGFTMDYVIIFESNYQRVHSYFVSRVCTDAHAGASL
ncbi:class I SAM-dependent methyltransferase [candidate division KSB1 bacterium]|nr:class I SAM-dependent methyltransferase [candidate division KSB1 bacterium]